MCRAPNINAIPFALLLVISGKMMRTPRGTHAPSPSVAFPPHVLRLLMTYFFASLHSACPENNEGVCCINLCNGEREEGRDGGGGGGAAAKQEGEKRRVMSSCCCTAALLYTLGTLRS